MCAYEACPNHRICVQVDVAARAGVAYGGLESPGTAQSYSLTKGAFRDVHNPAGYTHAESAGKDTLHDSLQHHYIQ